MRRDVLGIITNLIELLSHYEEYCVQKVNKFGEKIPPGEVESPLGGRTVRVVHRLTDPVVLSSHVEAPALQEHPETEDGLEEIVGQHEAPDLIRFSVLHEPGVSMFQSFHSNQVIYNTE